MQSFNIKTSSSVSLPIWTCPLGGDEPGSRWGGMIVDESEWGGLGDDGNKEAEQSVDQAEQAKTQKAAPQSNGRKRTASPEGEVGVVKKKLKQSGMATVVFVYVLHARV